VSIIRYKTARRIAAGTAFAILSLAAALPAAPGRTEVRVARVILPAAAPEAFSLTLPLGGEDREVVLRKRSFRAPGFRLRTWTAEDGSKEVAAPPPSTVVGHIAGDPASRAAGGLGPRGLTLRITSGRGEVWWLRPPAIPEPGAGPATHTIQAGDPPLPEGRRCGLDHPEGLSWEEVLPPTEPGPGGGEGADIPPWLPPPGDDWCGPSVMMRAQIAFDVDFPYYQDQGSSVPAVVANVETHIAVVNAYYARDALIEHEITDILVRTDPFYFPDAVNNLLDLFLAEWNANQASVLRDMAHLMTAQPDPGLAGLAYVSVTCNLAWAYGYSVDSSRILGHELGHNWGAGHCHDTSPCNNMCGSCLYIAPNTKEIITAFRDSRTCLEEPGPFVDPMPPYAHPDRLVLERDEAVMRPTLAVDVLANDHDANCDGLAIDAHDDRSVKGGFVERDVGGGPDGRDRLLYTPPCGLFAGEDRFGYTLGDASGEQVAGRVTVALRRRGLAGYWPLDETAGAVAFDRTGHHRDGALQGDPVWGAGWFAGALSLDGLDDYVAVPALNVEGTELTVSAWIRRAGPQEAWAGLFFGRASGTVAGLNFGTGDELRYHWNGDVATWNWDSGLTVPDDQWVFTALVVEPDQATIYLHDTALRSAVNVVPHARQTFAGETSLGRDPSVGTRHFAGLLDDVRVYDYALTPEEVRDLCDLGGRARAPRPADGGFLDDLGAGLTWTPGHGAGSHDIYFGADYPAVRDATPASPAFQGNQTAAAWTPPGPLSQDATYYWRVDEVVGPEVLAGETWLFTVDAHVPGLEGYWPLDDPPGIMAADLSGNARHGRLTGGPVRAAGVYDGALELDGSDDSIEIPPLEMEGTEVTIAAWVRRDGPQSAWAGIVFSREGGTVAGLNLGNGAELRYHWNDDAGTWGWDSGLVLPDGLWVFTALVVEPDRATIYLHDAAMRSAVNLLAHAPQTFAGTTLIGRDPAWDTRWFRGGVDEVRIYDQALSPSEIADLQSLGGPAVAPVPADGARVSVPPTFLSWVPGPGAGSHDVYLGTDPVAVRDATPASPVEFRGNQATSSHDLNGEAEPGGTYYWRVDERAGALGIAGSVWRFSVAEGVGGSLRVAKTEVGEPVLSWLEVGNAALYDLLRCVPPPAGGCAPATFDTVGPYVTTFTDAEAPASSLVWYAVREIDPCAP